MRGSFALPFVRYMTLFFGLGNKVLDAEAAVDGKCRDCPLCPPYSREK